MANRRPPADHVLARLVINLWLSVGYSALRFTLALGSGGLLGDQVSGRSSALWGGLPRDQCRLA
jgi:hypothetical protein